MNFQNFQKKRLPKIAKNCYGPPPNRSNFSNHSNHSNYRAIVTVVTIVTVVSIVTIITWQVHTQDVKKVVWHPTDPLLFSAGYDDTVKVYKEFGDDWECAESLTG